MRNLLECLRLLDRRAVLRFGLLFPLSFGQMALEAIALAAVAPLLAMITAPGSGQEYKLIRLLGELAQRAGLDWPVLALLCLLVVAATLAKNAVLIMQTKLQADLTQLQAAALGVRMFRTFLTAEAAERQQRHSSEDIVTIENSTENFFSSVLMSALSAMSEALIIAGLALVMVISEPYLTLGIFSFLLPVGAVVHFGMRRWNRHFGVLTLAYHEQRLRYLTQGLNSKKELTILGRGEHFVRRYAAEREGNAHLNSAQNVRMVLPRVALEIAVVSGVITVILTTLLSGDITRIGPALGMAAVAAFRMLPSFSRLTMNLHSYHQGTAAMERVLASLRCRPAMAERLHQEDPGAPPFRRAVTLADVSYSYDGRDQPAIARLSLSVEKGEAIALVGNSGAGKSTAVDIILGILKPQAGSVLADGQDIFANLAGWRRQIGYVPQAIYIADDTVRRNVAYGLDDDAIDDARVWEALSKARLDGFVESLPDGLDTVLGESGGRMSGGQRQRIGIARALYHRPEIIILDEATAALDNETERSVAESVRLLRSSAAVIVVAHRMATVRDCARIYFLENGRVVESGPFDELMEHCQAFRSMVLAGDR